MLKSTGRTAGDFIARQIAVLGDVAAEGETMGKVFVITGGPSHARDGAPEAS